MKNTKTFVTVLAAALLAAVMVFTSCSQPTDGDPGSPGGSGSPGGVVLSGDVLPSDLEAVFAVSPIAILGSGTESVYGVIPLGKTLIVAENALGEVPVKDGETLDVEGTLEIRPKASLDASGTGGTSGTLGFAGGSVLSNGTVKIDLAQADKLGSISGAGIAAVLLADLTTLGINSPSAVYVNENVTVAPAIGTYLGVDGNALYLGGAVTGDSALDLSSKPGNLVIDESGSYTASANLTASNAGNIIVKGTLSVGVVTLAGKFDLQDGTLEVTAASPTTTGASFTGNKIKALTTSAAAAVTLTGVTEIGTWTVSGGTPTLTAAALTTIGKIAADEATTLPGSVTTIDEVSGDSAVTLGTDATLTIASGKTLEIKGSASIVSTTGSGTTLGAGTYTAAGGNVTLAKAGALTIAGTLTGKPLITTFNTATGYSIASLNKLTGLTTGAAITYSDSTLTGSEGTLTIPENLSVTVSSGTLEDITGLTIGKNATLTASAGTFAKVTSGTLGEGAALTASASATFPELLTLVFGKGASATATGATFPKATSITLGEDVEVSMDEDGATLGELLTLTLGEGAELEAENATLAKLTTLTIAEGAELKVEKATFDAITATSTVSGEGTLVLGTLDISKPALAPLLNIAKVESGVATLSEAFTVPEDTTVVLHHETGATGPTSLDITVNGWLIVAKKLTLNDDLNIGNDGALVLAPEAQVVLNGSSAKISAPTKYNLSGAGGVVTAGAGSAYIVFSPNSIAGYKDEQDKLSEVTGTIPNAAVLAFTTADATLAITGNTAIDGVILDVSAKGIITVAANQTLTLVHGAGTGKASGGIFTAEVEDGAPLSVVKANAATPKSDGDFTNAAALAGAETQKAAAGTAGNLGTGSTETEPADGKIGKDAAVTIDAEDTFTIISSPAITVDHDA